MGFGGQRYIWDAEGVHSWLTEYDTLNKIKYFAYLYMAGTVSFLALIIMYLPQENESI